MNNDTSLKEYYVNLQSLYNRAVNMLLALNTSLTTSASQVEVNVADTDDASSTIRIPSFLYLENKLEELNSNIDALFNIPEDGEAWFTKSDTSYKLNLVRSNTSPVSPVITNTNNVTASITDNNFLKDLVSPKTFLKLDIGNLPDNISQMYMRKIVCHSYDTFNSIMRASNGNQISYSDCSALLYSLKKGVDYDEYDSVVDLPIKKDMFKSAFNIEEIITPAWIDNETKKTNYIVRLNTLTYQNEEDSSITYSLKLGDSLILGNSMNIYKINGIYSDQTVQIEEVVGHTVLTTFAENNMMQFKVYIADYSKYHYVQVPLEENQYVIIFIGTIWNNVRSLLSTGLCVDLSSIMMVDKNGQAITDDSGNQYSYMSYYKTYCTNLGDIILGMSKCSYSQITNYTATELKNLLTSNLIKQNVNSTIDENTNIKVVAINKHLVDDKSVEDIVNLHNQKNEINSKLQTCQSNIDQVYSTMLTTDFSQNVVVTQASLQEKIQSYYSERTSLQKQLNALVDNINSKADTLATSTTRTKYRVRGVSNTSMLEEYLKENYLNAQLIGIDIEYKYKSTSKDTATLTTINSVVYTDWNKQQTYDKERKLDFTDNGYNIVFINSDNDINTIKWNQFDIPIKEGEDVVIRVRYKYSIGQPFITLYTPWSDEKTIVFPSEFVENVELESILATNAKDTVTAAFNTTLINEGYSEHIQNKVLSNEQVFFHMPENIYSGFNTAENNLISLKDKLLEMTAMLDKYKEFIEANSNNAFEVYLNYDDNSVLLSPNSINKINIYNADHITDMFIRKDMNIVIRNTSNNTLKLYSIFPGNTDTHLISSSVEAFKTTKGNYERVPIINADVLDGQYLGQWIYFRQNNPYSFEDYYYNTLLQNQADYNSGVGTDTKPTFLDYFGNYMSVDNKQALLPFRANMFNTAFNFENYDPSTILINNVTVEKLIEMQDAYNKYQNKLSSFEFFNYSNMNILKDTDSGSNGTLYVNQYILKYEDFIVQNNMKSSPSYLDSKTSLTEALDPNNKGINYKTTTNGGTTKLINTTQMIGAFLYPNILNKAQLLTPGGQYDYKAINAGQSVSIPIVFEYYVEASKTTITKTLAFDIKNSLINEPIHFILSVTGNFDYTTTGEIYKDIDNITE